MNPNPFIPVPVANLHESRGKEQTAGSAKQWPLLISTKVLRACLFVRAILASSRKIFLL